jgi:hypothetical protein
MIRRSFALMVALAVAMPAPAAAQRSHNDATALQALRNYALCAARQAPGDSVETLLAMDPDSPDHDETLRRFARGYGRCMTAGTSLEFGGLPFSGDLAEAVIAGRYRDRSLADAAAAVPPLGAANVVQAIGRCVARAKPAAVTELLATEPGTEEELAALQQTGETLPGCIPGGLTLTLNKPAVRAIYALGAYSLLAAADAHEDGE